MRGASSLMAAHDAVRTAHDRIADMQRYTVKLVVLLVLVALLAGCKGLLGYPIEEEGPTPTPIPAPVLRSPPDGHVYAFRDEIVLEWEPVGQLAADEFYVPIVERTQWGNLVLDETPFGQELPCELGGL